MIPGFAASGPLSTLDDSARSRLLERSTSTDALVRASVAQAIVRVQFEGDAALRDFAREFDGALLDSLEVPRGAIRSALARLAPELRASLERAARNIEVAHRAMAPRPVEIETEPGVVVGRRPDPLARVGLYAPGGTARYPSSVLMAAIPARVAGVPEVMLCSPPDASGAPSQVVLAAAGIAGVDRVFAVGGAGAIAAMALGTETIPRVDRIVGPGGAYVTEAKIQLAGVVSSDAPAGPSELLAIVDPDEDLAAVAADLIAQAEHDPRAAIAVVVVGDASAAEAAAARLAVGILDAAVLTPRAAIVREALAGNGALLWTDSRGAAIEFATDYAPEHLLLAVPEPESWLPSIRHAGTVYLGTHASPVFGDYLTGANHTLPTGGASRSWSGLSTGDFVRWTTWQSIAPEAAARMADATARIADAEGLPGHASAVRSRARFRTAAGNGPRSVPMIELGDNTNRFGAPPAAVRVVAEARPDETSEYPTATADLLRAAIAETHGVSVDQVVTGSGSGEVIECAIRTFARAGDRLVFPVPTFSMLPEYARHHRLTPVPVPFLANGDLDVDAMLDARPQVIYLCTPNNPTGHLPLGEVERLFDSGALVIVDEAYAEYAGHFRVARPCLPRLLVTRTLSKAYGLAGFRVGFGIGCAEPIEQVTRMRGPYRVGRLAERAAVAVLRDDQDWVRTRVERVGAERDALAADLRALGLQPLPSRANFVLVPLPKAAKTSRDLAERGVRVRAFTELPAVGDALRITIGPRHEMEAVLRALAESLEPSRSAPTVAFPRSQPEVHA